MSNQSKIKIKYENIHNNYIDQGKRIIEVNNSYPNIIKIKKIILKNPKAFFSIEESPNICSITNIKHHKYINLGL